MSPIRNRFSSAGHTEAALLGSHATPRSQAVALSYEAHAVAPALYAAVAEILVWAYQIDASSQALHVVNSDQDNINDTDVNSGI